MMRTAAKFFIAVTVVTLALSPLGNSAHAIHEPGHTATQPTATQGPRPTTPEEREQRYRAEYQACLGRGSQTPERCAEVARLRANSFNYTNVPSPDQEIQRVLSECSSLSGSAWRSCVGGGIANSISSDLFGKSVCTVFTLSVDAVWCLLTYVIFVVYWIVSAFLWIAAVLFDTVLNYLVIKMGNYVHSDTVQAAWKIIRNLINLGIIAGFVAVGISTILQVGYKADQWLAKLVIAALLVNFSFFFAGAMIDASNFVATEIYEQQIQTAVCDGSLPTACASGQSSISTAILSFMKLGSVENLKAFALDSGSRFTNADGTNASPAQKYILLGVIGIGLMIGMMVIFFVTSFLLIGRFVALILLLIASPVGIAGLNVPYISEKYAGQWWTNFVGQVLFAPVYLLLLAISLTLAKSLTLVQSQALAGGSVPEGFWQIASGDERAATNAIVLVVQYIVVIVFMYLSLSIARSMSKEAAQFKPIYDWTGWVGRQTVGKYATRFADAFPRLGRWTGAGMLSEQDFGDGQSFYAEKKKKGEKSIGDLITALNNRNSPQTAQPTSTQTNGVSPNNRPVVAKGGQPQGKSVGGQNKDGRRFMGRNAEGLPVYEGDSEGRMLGRAIKQGARGVAGAAGNVFKSIKDTISPPKPAPTSAAVMFGDKPQAGQQPDTQTPPTAPPPQSAPNTTALAAGPSAPPQPPPQSPPETTTLAAGPSSGALLPPELQGRLSGAAQTHFGIQLIGQVQGHSETIAGEMKNAGEAEAIIASTTQAHNDHLESLRKLREKSANDQEHNERVNAANAALKRIEDRESATMSQISERIGRLQGELSSASRPSSVGGVASTPQDQKVEKAQMELRALEQGLNRIKGAQADRRTAHNLVIGNAKPTNKI